MSLRLCLLELRQKKTKLILEKSLSLYFSVLVVFDGFSHIHFLSKKLFTNNIPNAPITCNLLPKTTFNAKISSTTSIRNHVNRLKNRKKKQRYQILDTKYKHQTNILVRDQHNETFQTQNRMLPKFFPTPNIVSSNCLTQVTYVGASLLPYT